jgi:hypothetical protein
VSAAASSDSRNMTRSATSAAWPKRRSATVSVTAARVPPGSIAVRSTPCSARPGTTALTRIPDRPARSASALISAAMPGLDPKTAGRSRGGTWS